MTKQRIAIFDLDETLTRKGTWGRFVTSQIRRQPFKWLPFFLSSLGSQALYMLGFGPRERVKETMMGWTIAGRSRESLVQAAEDFANVEVNSGLRAAAVAKIKAHRAAGDRLIIASAAVDLIVYPIARRLGIAETVCTATAFTADGRLAKKLGGPNCYGPGKLQMVEAHLTADPEFSRPLAHITVYSDSSSDLPVLLWADEGIAVNPSPRLRKAALAHNLRTEDWDAPTGKNQKQEGT